MKNLLTGILIITTLFLSSCQYYVTSGVIINIQNYNKDSLCIYEVSSEFLIYPDYKFVMPCDKFNMGDTITLTKY